MSVPAAGRDITTIDVEGRLYADDLAIGDWMALGTVSVTRDEIVQFAMRYDPLPIHIDGAGSPFGDVIASGMHTLALFSSLCSPNFLARMAVVAGKGIDRLRLPHPVRPGAVLSANAEVVDISMGSRRADVHCRYEMQDQDSNVVMSMVGVQVINRRCAEKG
ncbi:MaoC/PaaZ C-terminal domain-containing protein [Micromonospora sp. WMMD736]|uniref:MaoC/PaaZ C-terminal domain-containing protein n=1 Tax=Micromonospora sp. WMMD736 TaxID=3404112 RepID=UPI003B959046